MNAASKTALASQFRNESAGDKGTCSRAPEDLGAALRHTVSPMLWSYDSRASGGSLYPHTAEQVCVLDGCLVRVKYKDCPDKVSVMANVRGILLNSYRRDNIAAEDRV